MFQLLRAEIVEFKEESVLLHQGIPIPSDSTPWPEYDIHEEWLQKRGELVLTNKRLLFFTHRLSLFGKKIISLELALSRKTIMANLLCPNRGSPILEILAGADTLRFSVANPEAWIKKLIGD